MIRRDLPARRGEAALVIPRDRSGDLPPLSGHAPSSPGDVLTLAVDYADAHPGHGQERALVKLAWRALMKAFPAIARQDVEARLSGVDVLGGYLVRLDGPETKPSSEAYALPPAPARPVDAPPF